MSDVARICGIITFHLSKLWKVKFSILCDVIFLVTLQGNFDIDHSQEWKGWKALNTNLHSTWITKYCNKQRYGQPVTVLVTDNKNPGRHPPMISSLNLFISETRLHSNPSTLSKYTEEGKLEPCNNRMNYFNMINMNKNVNSALWCEKVQLLTVLC